MRLSFSLFLISALSLNSSAQQGIALNVNAVTSFITVKHDSLFYVADEMPAFESKQFKGCMKQWLSANAVYPERALINDLQGKVFVSFTIGVDGNVTDVRITGSSDPVFEEETLKLFSRMPRWKPGIKDGSPVAVRINDFCMRYKLSGQLAVASRQ